MPCCLRFRCFPVPPVMRVTRSGRGRGTRRSRAGACSWCQSMGARAPPRCTWKARGPQDKFVSPACVRDACFGHMVASVWSGARVRRQNKDRLKRFSEELAGSGEEPAPARGGCCATRIERGKIDLFWIFICSSSRHPFDSEASALALRLAQAHDEAQR